MVCVLRVDHPALSTRSSRAAGPRKSKGKGLKPATGPLSLQTYASLSHALVSPSGEGPGPADNLLGELGLSRRVALRIPHFYSALAIVENSDLVLTAPAGLGRVSSGRVAFIPLPKELSIPPHAVDQVWHERFSNDAGHTWLRDLLLKTARAAMNQS